MKWVFRTKLNAYGSINKNKARQDTIRMLLAVATQKGWEICQLDVKSAFLNGFLEEEIYVKQPGFIVKGLEDKVYLLRKDLYGVFRSRTIFVHTTNQHKQASKQNLQMKNKMKEQESKEPTKLSYYVNMISHTTYLQLKIRTVKM
ncbi:hypothetical protein CR513_10438, partial [Mucuna pruriens]